MLLLNCKRKGEKVGLMDSTVIDRKSVVLQCAQHWLWAIIMTHFEMLLLLIEKMDPSQWLKPRV